MKLLVLAALLFSAPSAFATDFTVKIADQNSLDGIAWARERYNASHSDAPLADDAAYIQWVGETAAASYYAQKSKYDIDAAVAKCQSTGDCADAQALLDKAKK